MTRNRTVAVRTLGLSAFLLAIGAASPAWAGLTICNSAGAPVSAVVAWFPADEEGTSTNGHMPGTVHGWIKLAAGECKGVDDNSNAEGYFYYFAKLSDGSRNWEGRSRLCVRSRAFRSQQLFLMGGSTCSGDWYDVGFRRINSNATHYKLTLNL